ncbi:sphingomyelin phosphodiesterase, partial [Microvirga aerilata]
MNVSAGRYFICVLLYLLGMLSHVRAIWSAVAFGVAGFAFQVLSACLAVAATDIIVQNNTPFEFNATVLAPANMHTRAWRIGAARILPGRRETVLSFNRDQDVTNGQRFTFVTRLSKDGQAVGLRQQLLGRAVNSHMWQSFSAVGFEDRWFDDRETHVATAMFNGIPVRVLYRAFAAGTDDNVEYILQYAYPPSLGGDDQFSVLAYNIYMRPTTIARNGQVVRATLLPAQLRGYDAIVFSEAFDDGVRNTLLERLRPEYPYQTQILGRDTDVRQDGGVIIVSRWPIATEAQQPYGTTCAGIDCQAAKGVVYARIAKGTRTYHLFGTHTQAEASERNAREGQFRILKHFIDSQNIPATEPVLIAGDLNVDKAASHEEYQRMLEILDAEMPGQVGYPFSWDPFSNRLAERGKPGEMLDYVLWSKAHRAPAAASNEVRILRSDVEWKEFAFEYPYWDLSDHYPVHGLFRFEEGGFTGTFPLDRSWIARRPLYVVRPGGELV